MTRSFRELAEECVRRCHSLAQFTETPGSITRTFLSPPIHECHLLIAEWMQALGMLVRVDSIGNLRGLSRDRLHMPRLLLGSHLDTVPCAGAYDGVLGVCLALSLVESARALALPFDIEVIGFSEEEGVRFRKPFLGSLAVAGQLAPEMLALHDSTGVTIAEAIRQFGLDPGKLADAEIDSRAFAFLEFHIEQGPVLDAAGESLAVVVAIAGQSRWEMTFAGRANHAGTTPMELRRDALGGAAEWINMVEAIGASAHGLVATVGKLEILPNAGNVIPGEVRASLDVRHSSDEIRTSALQAMQKEAERIALKRGLTIRCEELLNQPAVPMDQQLVDLIQQAMDQMPLPSRRMVSGAGHDAMIMAAKLPTAMVFLRSPGGISHHPDESICVADVEKAIHAGHLMLSNLARTLEMT